MFHVPIIGALNIYREFKMNTSSWIKMSERKPTEADLPIVMGLWANDNSGRWIKTFCWENIFPVENWTHWAPMNKIPAPPESCTALQSLYLQKHPRPYNTEMFAHQRGWEDGVRDERSAVRSMFDHYRLGANSCEQLREVAHRIIERIES